MEAIQVFLKKYGQIPSKEKCIALLLAEENFFKVKQALEEEQNQMEIIQELLLQLIHDLQLLNEIQPKQAEEKGINKQAQKKQEEKSIAELLAEEQAARINSLFQDHNAPQFFINLDGDDDDDDYDKESIIFTNTDVFETPSVEDLVPIPSESEDTSGSESVCILPSCDDFSPIDIPEEKAVTFSNLLFNSNNDFISSDDESLSDEDVPKDNVKNNSNPLFEIDDEYISSDVNPLFDEVLEDIECMNSYDPNLDEPNLLVTPFSDANKDECFDSGSDDDEINVLDCEDGYYDSKGDILYLESLLNDDLVHRDLSIPAMRVASFLGDAADGVTGKGSLMLLLLGDKCYQVILVLPVFVSVVKERLMLLELDYKFVLLEYITAGKEELMLLVLG
nr:hypothetical protein [Tanacetum cinerariifolium]